jgi:hypothetical protein
VGELRTAASGCRQFSAGASSKVCKAETPPDPTPRGRGRRLANGPVESPFSHQSLAQQILDCFVTCCIEVTTEDEREARRLTPEAPGLSKP